ncbi:4-hydroxythreonine-4-phosphate dehydrogenase [Hydrogenimonas thermophila]|uniref:4-hydroxythreonine-4-phosphate dehydrogenase n=1 Tax=Hydrogenimonas thermophila TaxID=223786 RepID=UPI0029371844|nr:4-hydroxythreonine-4-phosphate dehydrogenase [Hydrogenimonas thermophila]WOE69153.1 4-hydroxythreonine-4-phosphate dehydrogenase [Hydrogenimonas thermophila]WOE71663.1 4-hydroxythreonine-4-phosphate dehydrogenase [Hydrogenimonas thermophila]
MKIAISIGDPNGIGPEIALKAHEKISEFCHPVYFAGIDLFEQAAEKLDLKLPKNLVFISPAPACTIQPGVTTAEAGAYSFASFKKAVDAVKTEECDAVVTLPINKESWMKAGIDYKGHTDALRDFFKKEAIMMLGCEKMYVALFTEHIPLKEVPKKIKKETLVKFLTDFQKETGAKKIGVLGLNPHAGDNGVLGNEEKIITEAIKEANQSIIQNSKFKIQHSTFQGPLVPDIAFSPKMRESFKYYVTMYHDQGLAPLKALYFDESINVSLNLPIVRTSVDHGTAFDIAYQKNRPINLKSYIEAVKAAIELKKKRDSR